jgi:hypothetical protein
MGKKKNPAAVALGKLAASKRTKEELAEAGRRGGLRKAENHKAADLADAVHDHFEEIDKLAATVKRGRK